MVQKAWDIMDKDKSNRITVKDICKDSNFNHLKA